MGVAWVLLGNLAVAHGSRMDLNRAAVSQVLLHMSTRAVSACRGLSFLGGSVSDVLYIGLIIVVFAALWLLVKGVERFER
jgi:hypothetical protein